MKALAVGSLLLAGLSVCAADQITPIAPKKGAFSLGLAADYFKAQHSDSVTSIDVTPTYFVTDNIEIGIPFGWSHSSGDDITRIGAEARFYFMKNEGGQFHPFVGAMWQTISESGFSDETFWGGEIGAHYFVANNVALTGQFILGSDRIAGVSESTTQFHIGFTIFFPGK